MSYSICCRYYEAALKETVKIAQYNRSLFTYVVDILNKEAVFTFAEEVIEEHGKVDGIIQPFVYLNECLLK